MVEFRGLSAFTDYSKPTPNFGSRSAARHRTSSALLPLSPGQPRTFGPAERVVFFLPPERMTLLRRAVYSDRQEQKQRSGSMGDTDTHTHRPSIGDTSEPFGSRRANQLLAFIAPFISGPIPTERSERESALIARGRDAL